MTITRSHFTGGPDNLLSGWRSAAEPQEVTAVTRILGNLLSILEAFARRETLF